MAHSQNRYFHLQSYSHSQHDSVQQILICSKTSQEYNQELRHLLAASTLDKQSIEILNKFDNIYNENNPLEAPLNEADLARLPNLFTGPIESIDYKEFIQLLFDLSKLKLLTRPTLKYLQEHLNRVDFANLSNLRSHILVTILYILFYQYYGENGCNLAVDSANYETRSKIRDQISKFLSKPFVNIEDESEFKKLVPRDLHGPCSALNQLLHHKNDRQLRFSARDICHHLSIKLELTLMICLCIDAIKTEEAEEQVKNLVLVIGNTGAGKSTSINYLTGVEYERKIKHGKYYLKQKNVDQLAPARVGHGDKSETLYPQVHLLLP